MIPDHVIEKLSDPRFHRGDPAPVRAALAALGVGRSNEDFAAFFEKFRGPVGSERTGFQLLDLIEEEPSIVSSTEIIRTRFGVADRYLVISDYLAGAVLVYDTERDTVLNVDFEGGVELLQSGALKPQWASFESFLAEFFA